MHYDCFHQQLDEWNRMNKNIIFLLTLILVSPVLQAKNVEKSWSVGVNISQFSRDLSISDAKWGDEMPDIHSGFMTDNLDQGSGYGLTLGKRITNSIRLSLGFNTNEKQHGSFNLGPTNSGSTNSHLDYRLEQQEWRISADYLFNLFSSSSIDGYIGAHFGLSDISYSFERSYDLGYNNKYGARSEDRSLLIGLQAGIEYYFYPNISTEIGFLYSRYDHELSSDDPTIITYLPEVHNVRLKSQGSAFIGLKFHF